MLKKTWKRKAKMAVREKAFEYLVSDSRNKSKTKKVCYSSYSRQSYLFQYGFKEACTIFKLRSRSINCRGNHKSSSSTMVCRLCKVCDETQRHIVNCHVSADGPILDISVIYGEEIPPNDPTVLQICSRVQSFHRKLNEQELHESHDV